MKISEKSKREKNRIHLTSARSRQLLFSGSCYITLVLAVMLCAVPMVLSYFVAALIADFTFPWVSTVLMLTLWGAVFVPMTLGAVRVAVAIYCGGDSPLSEIFFAFSSARAYFRALLLGIIVLGRVTVILLPAAFAFDGVELLTENISAYSPLLSYAASWLTFIAVAAILDNLLSPVGGTVFFAFADGDIRPIFGLRESIRRGRHSIRRTLTSRLPMALLAVLSALPLCLPLLFCTLPYMMCRYVYSAAHSGDSPMLPDNINEEIIETGDINNEQH